MNEQINQDRSFILSPFQGLDNHRLLGVFDGHGNRGEVVSQYAVDHLPSLLLSKLHRFSSLNETRISQEMETILIETFVELDQTAPPHAAITGGCTASILLQMGYQVYIANAGDSRSFVARYSISSSSLEKRVEILYATREDKPHLPEEKQRILDMGGQVYIPPPHKVGSSSRVVYVDEEDGGTHGLAMSRSIGDWAAGKVGFIPNPIVDRLDLRDYLQVVSDNATSVDGDEMAATVDVHIFAFSATDGLLDYVTEQEIADMVGSSLYQEDGVHPLLACESLILEAAGRWWNANGGRYRDDIALAFSKLSV